jgi:hypothetical protein
MPSLVDFLQFLLRQPAPDSNSFGSNGATLGSNGADNDPLSADPLGPSDTSTQIFRNAGNPWAAFGLSAQAGSPAYQSPQWDVASQSSNRGVLGGYPSPPDASRPAGILYTYDGSARQQVDSPRSQLFDPPSQNAFGGDPTPIVNPPLSTVPNRARAPTMAPGFSNGASSSLVMGKLSESGAPENRQSPPDLSYPSTPTSRARAAQAAAFSSRGPLPPFPAMTGASKFLNAQTYSNLGIDIRVHRPGTPVWPAVGNDEGWPNTNSSPGGAAHWSEYLQPAQVILPPAVTGDPRIDRTSQTLLDTLVEVIKEFGEGVPEDMRPTVFGTLAHDRFAKKIAALDLPGIGEDGIEQSWSLGDLVDYGISGSKRTDIYLKDEFGRPIAVYDLKTGNAHLTAARVREIQKAVGIDDIPVFELSWRDLTASRPWR